MSMFSVSEEHKRTKCPPHLKSAIREKWWGDTLNGECFCCGRPNIYYDDAEVGHIQASSKGGKWSPNNCRLVCRRCNSGMRNKNMKTYMKQTYHERYEKYFSKEEEKQKGVKVVIVKLGHNLGGPITKKLKVPPGYKIKRWKVKDTFHGSVYNAKVVKK